MKRADLWRGVVAGVLFLAWTCLAAGRGGYFDDVLEPATERLSRAEVVVLDGDTILVGGVKVRLLGVDTPECGAPWFEGDQEPWAGQARDLLVELLASGGEITLQSWGSTDVYDRRLAHLFVAGESVSLRLVQAGLAYPTVQRYGDQGFPELAAQLLQHAKRPTFQVPWRWRREHRIPAR